VLHVRSVEGYGGGPEKTILNSPRFLKPLGYDAVCGYLHPPGDPAFSAIQQRAAAAGARLLSIPDRGPLDWRPVRELIRVCRELKPAIWHGHDYKTDVLGLLVKRFWPMKLATTVHGWVTYAGRLPSYYRIDKLCLRFYDAVISVSEDIHTECLRVGVPKSRCHLVFNAIDTDDFRRVFPSRGAASTPRNPPDTLLLGAMGRLCDEKGFDLLIRATDALIRNGHRVSLRIAGEGSARPQMEALVNELGRNEDIQLLGHVADVKQFYEALDVFVLSSLREGLPNVLLEAMSMEVPVVATRVAGVPSLVRDGRNGLLVDANSVGCLATGIQRLLHDRELCRRFSKAGRRTIEQSYSFESRIRRIAGIYGRLLHGETIRRDVS